MPLTDDDFRALIRLLQPIFHLRSQREYWLDMSFPSEEAFRLAVPPDGINAAEFTQQLVSYLNRERTQTRDGRLSLLVLLQNIQSNGGDLAEKLIPFIAQLESGITPVTPLQTPHYSEHRQDISYEHRSTTQLAKESEKTAQTISRSGCFAVLLEVIKSQPLFGCIGAVLVAIIGLGVPYLQFIYVPSMNATATALAAHTSTFTPIPASSTPSLTATITLTQPTPTTPSSTPTVDKADTIIAMTSLANAQSTSELATVQTRFTQTAISWTRTPTMTSTWTMVAPPASATPQPQPPNSPTVATTLANATAVVTVASINGYTPITETDPDSGYIYALVPEGIFSDTRGSATHAFKIGVYVVTNVQFAAFLNSRGNQSSDGQKRLSDSNAGVQIHVQRAIWQVDGGLDNYPVIQVTGEGANDYCQYIGARLPTATEWHKAAAWNPATQQTSIYPWGDNPPTQTLANSNSVKGGTTPVGTYEAGRSVIGAYDMSGNVFQWTATNIGTNTVRMGGAWDSLSKEIKADAVDLALFSTSANDVGFRCAKDK